MIYMHKRLLSLFILIVLAFNLSASPDKVRMISIGVDYKNSDDEELILDGTLNDAYEMVAAFSTIMKDKGVEFEPVIMVQEGSADYIAETVIDSEKNSLKLLKSVRKAYSKSNKFSDNYFEYVRDDGSIVVRDSLSDIDKVYDLIDRVEDIKTKDGDFVDIIYFDIKDTYLYPTSENIINEVIRASDLDYDDLLIIYFSGHGGEVNAFAYDDIDNLLTSFVMAGKITEEDKAAVLDNESCYISDTVLEQLCRMDDVDEDVLLEIYDAMEASDDVYPTGVLSTAKSADDVFVSSGTLEMMELYLYLSYLKCDCVLILDACHSGYASIGIGDYIDESDYDHAVNIEVLSSSSTEEYSSETTIETDEGEYEQHGAFTAEILSHLGWVHSSKITTELVVPYFTAVDDVIDVYDQTALVSGYLKTLPKRQTASEFYESVIADWKDVEQSPEADDSNYLLYLIP